MDYSKIINELSRNKDIFKGLLSGLTETEYLWKSNPEKWCLLEIVNHLYDEEREDFRARTKHILETPNDILPSIDPTEWVLERKYMQQNYADKLNHFLNERGLSVKWLQSLHDPKWGNVYKHPKFRDMTAKMFLANWLAHDYMHIKQILKLKLDHLKQHTNESLTYAGEWQ